jgi:prevent-host-death family protein
MTIMTVSEARAALPELLTRVEEGEEVTITRHGRAVAVLVRPDVRRARARAPGRMPSDLSAAGHGGHHAAADAAGTDGEAR